jgi:tetratricopeptide (TPR) repeat protein
MRPLLPALLAAAFCLAPSLPARAQAKKPPAASPAKLAEAKKLFDQGKALYLQGSYQDAIDAWLKAYDLSGKPLMFDNIANAFERLGDARKAHEYLQRWRDAAPKDELPTIDARLKNLEARIAREDEAEAARKAEEQKAAEEAKRKKEAPPPPPPKPQGLYVPGLVVMGAGVAAVGVGVTLDLVAAGERPSAQSACVTTAAGPLCKASDRSAILSSNTFASVGDVLWIAGSAVAVGGLVLVLTHRDAPAKEPAVGWYVVPAVSPTLGGVAAFGRF